MFRANERHSLVGVMVSPAYLGESVPALIDTGSCTSFIDLGLASRLGIEPVGRRLLYSLSTSNGEPVPRDMFTVSVDIQTEDKQVAVADALDVIGSDLVDNGIGFVLGRDLLSLCRLTYTGLTGEFEIEVV